MHIKNEIKKVIFEDYASTNELRRLSDEVLQVAAKENINYITELLENGREFPSWLYPVAIRDINSEKYNVLKDFILNSDVTVGFQLRGGKFSRGGNQTKALYLPETKEIDILFEKSFIENVVKDFKDGKLNERILYSTLHIKYNESLSHELQHAFDDFRSSGKSFESKKAQKYFSKYFVDGEEIDFNDDDLSNKSKSIEKNKAYLKLPHEIEARFVQVLNSGRFQFSQLDFGVDKNGNDILIKQMIPLDAVLKHFKSLFTGWSVMSLNTKKRLLARVSQYWHREKEQIETKKSN